MAADADNVVVDVVILGGGIQGLWLLSDLRKRGYSAILLEPHKLGGRQTGHSHVYLHQGHMYVNLDFANPWALVPALKSAKPLWETWLGSKKPIFGELPSYFGFRHESTRDLYRKIWDDAELNLPYREVPLPAVLAKGAIREIYELPVTCLNAEWMVRELSREAGDSVSRIGEVQAIETDMQTHRVEKVVVKMQNGTSMTLRPRALVLAAGQANQSLLNMCLGIHDSPATSMSRLQRMRMAHMLVVRGPVTDFTPVSGIFPDIGGPDDDGHIGLFIVARRTDTETVWLVSGDKSPVIADYSTYDSHAAQKTWLRRILGPVIDLAPSAFKNLDGLTWAIYEAPKSEASPPAETLAAKKETVPEEYVGRFGLDNAWALWPAKLTLAPWASKTATDQISEYLGEGTRLSRPAVWEATRVPAEVAPELWTTRRPWSWTDFRHEYSL